MNSGPDDRLLRVAEMLADGVTVDWDDLQRNEPELARAFRRLRELEALSAAHHMAALETEGGTSGPTFLLPRLPLARNRRGDASVRDTQARRYFSILCRWARGRSLRNALDVREIQDIVRETLVATLARVDTFEVRDEGAFLAYLSRAFLNRMRDEVRRAHRRPARKAMETDLGVNRRSVVEETMGSEAFERYEKALAELSVEQREAVILKLEFGYSYLQIAEAMGKPSANAARMVVSRALVRLVKGMNGSRP